MYIKIKKLNSQEEKRFQKPNNSEKLKTVFETEIQNPEKIKNVIDHKNCKREKIKTVLESYTPNSLKKKKENVFNSKPNQRLKTVFKTVSRKKFKPVFN